MRKCWGGFLGTVALAACAGSEQTTLTAFEIPVLFELTGDLADAGTYNANEFTMAADELNATSSCAPFKLQPSVRDTQTDAAVVKTLIDDLVDVQKVPLIVGPVRSVHQQDVVLPRTGPAGIMVLSPDSALPSLSSIATNNGFFYRNVADVDYPALQIPRIKADGRSRVAILLDDTFGVYYKEAYEAGLAAAGLTHTVTVTYANDEGSKLAQLNEIYATDPDAVLFIGNLNAATAQVVSDINLSFSAKTAKWYLHDNTGEASIRALVQPGGRFNFPHEGVQYEETRDQTFKERYKTRFGVDRGTSSVGQAYDLATLVCLAVSATGKNDAVSLKSVFQKLDGTGAKIYDLATEFEAARDALKRGESLSFTGRANEYHFSPKGDRVGVSMQAWRINSSGQLEVFARGL